MRRQSLLHGDVEWIPAFAGMTEKSGATMSKAGAPLGLTALAGAPTFRGMRQDELKEAARAIGAGESGLMELNERSREIFRQIVETYLATGEPVAR